ncbi:MAG: caspase family protein, partial [Bacteroidales bacterium]|nr:caspase family protein [Bacteroidales bacterium]
GKKVKDLNKLWLDKDTTLFNPEKEYYIFPGYIGVNLYDIEMGISVKSFRLGDFNKRQTKLSPNGKYLATTYENSLKIWNISTGGLLHNFNNHNSNINSSEFSQDGIKIVTSSQDSTVKVWDVINGKMLFDLKGHDAEVETASFSPDGLKIVSGDAKGIIRTWDLSTGLLLKRMEGHKSKINTIDFSPDETKLLTSSEDATAKIWDLNNANLVHNLNNHKKNVRAASFNIDAKKILTWSNDHTTKIWNTEDGSLICNFEDSDYDGYVGHSKYSTDGKFAASIHGKIAKIWDVESCELLQVLTGHDNNIWTIEFSNDNKYIVTLSHEDSTVIIWGFLSGESLFKIKNPGDRFNAFFSPDNKQIIITSYIPSGRWDIWDLKKRKLSFSLNNCWDLSSDGCQILASSSNYNIDVYDSKSGALIHTLKGHKDRINSAYFSKNSKNIVTASDDNITIVWDAITGKILAKFFMIDEKDNLNLTSDNYYLGSKSAINGLYWIINNKTIYPFDQFDLKYNRPDIVLERLGYADSTLIAAYHQAYLKRLKKMNFTEDMLKDDFHIPEIKIENFEELPTIINEKEINLDLNLNDSKYPLDRINVWVNDVAVYGTDGISIRDKNTMDYKTKIPVSLAKGENKVQVSVLNQAGAESYKESFYINCEAGKEQPDLYLITLGGSKYQNESFNLTYASKDAGDLAEVFKKSSVYKNIFTKTLINEQLTKENVLELKNFLKTADINDQVIIFLAGHGVLDENLDYYLATYDIDFNNPAKRGLAYEELESLLDGIKPLKKALFMDACHSGEIDKEEVELMAQTEVKTGDIQFRTVGTSPTPKLGSQNTSELTRSLFADIRKGTGATVISAAGGMEFAMESGEWKNGLFTYCLINGLQSKSADLNKDGKIMLSELQKYVQDEVVKLSGGKQQPTSRIENLEGDFGVW